MTDGLPTHLGRFRIEGILGRGAMGVVYKAHDPDIERTVAIKLIRADLLDGDSRERYLTRFRNEARIAGRCVHPNIVGLYDFAFEAGNPYLVLEYIDSVDLGRAFPRGTPVDEGTVVEIALQTLGALDYAHGFGIIHRDIKPANILLASDGRLKVTDFGISRFEFDETQSAVMVGTPSYMSPEQCKGAKIDQRCDLFSLGCVLYELASGQRAFSGASFAETLYKLTHEPHEPVRTVNATLSEDLARVIDRSLAKHPGDRFQTAADMAATLRRLGNRNVPAALTPAIGPGDEPATLILPAGTHPLSASRPGTASGSVERQREGTGPVLPQGTDPITDKYAESVIQALAHVMGPIAPHLVARARARAASRAELLALCAGMIDSPAERAEFEALAGR
jgi:eukaryotic-like serine/threonine-protein kinase